MFCRSGKWTRLRCSFPMQRKRLLMGVTITPLACWYVLLLTCALLATDPFRSHVRSSWHRPPKTSCLNKPSVISQLAKMARRIVLLRKNYTAVILLTGAAAAFCEMKEPTSRHSSSEACACTTGYITAIGCRANSSQGDTDQAIKHYQRGLKYNPDHKRCRSQLKVHT